MYGDIIYALVISQSMRRQPLSLAFSGYLYFLSGQVIGVAGGGDFWSSTSGSVPNARYLYFYRDSLNPQASSYKGYGFSVRCVDF